MQRYQLTLEKANILRQRFIDGEYHSWLLAKELRVSTITTWRYKREFERIRADYPDRLKDFGFYPGEPHRPHWETPKYKQLSLILPGLLAEEKASHIETHSIWIKYCRLSSDRYTFPSFKHVFLKWIKENITLTPQKLIDRITQEDLAILQTWRNSNNHRLWQIARSLEMAQQGASRKEIIDQVETIYKTLNQWLAGYRAKGLKAFELKPHETDKKVVKAMKGRKEKLLRLIHESPKLHQLNRTSWSLTALTSVYNKLYEPQLTYAQICLCVKQMGTGTKNQGKCLPVPIPSFGRRSKGYSISCKDLSPTKNSFLSMNMARYL